VGLPWMPNSSLKGCANMHSSSLRVKAESRIHKEFVRAVRIPASVPNQQSALSKLPSAAPFRLARLGIVLSSRAGRRRSR
jgi:hypothetical protein